MAAPGRRPRRTSMKRLLLPTAAIALAAAIAATLSPAPSRSQSAPPPTTVPAPRWTPRPTTAPIPITISPRKTAKPALEFALLPRIEDTKRGNAAVKYTQALSEMPTLSTEEWTYLDAARAAPLSDLKDD